MCCILKVENIFILSHKARTILKLIRSIRIFNIIFLSALNFLVGGVLSSTKLIFLLLHFPYFLCSLLGTPLLHKLHDEKAWKKKHSLYVNSNAIWENMYISLCIAKCSSVRRTFNTFITNVFHFQLKWKRIEFRRRAKMKGRKTLVIWMKSDKMVKF